MGVEQIHRDFGLILGAGLVAQFLATITRVPETILLVAAGAGHGPESKFWRRAATAGYLARRLGLIEGQEGQEGEARA